MTRRGLLPFLLTPLLLPAGAARADGGAAKPAGATTKGRAAQSGRTLRQDFAGHEGAARDAATKGGAAQSGHTARQDLPRHEAATRAVKAAWR